MSAITVRQRQIGIKSTVPRSIKASISSVVICLICGSSAQAARAQSLTDEFAVSGVLWRVCGESAFTMGCALDRSLNVILHGFAIDAHVPRAAVILGDGGGKQQCFWRAPRACRSLRRSFQCWGRRLHHPIDGALNTFYRGTQYAPHQRG